MAKCSVCDRKVVGRGFCKNHYRAFMKYGDPLVRMNLRGLPFDQRYEIDIHDCWIWRGGKDSSGYGIINEYGETKAHRVSWIKYRGPIPVGKHVLHTCDIPACVNPAHLFIGTHLENMRDMKKKGRSRGAIGETNAGAKITEAQAKIIIADSRRAYVIAEEYGISKEMVSLIRRGKAWAHIFDPVICTARREARFHKLTEDDIAAIIKDPRRQKEIATTYRVSQAKISAVMRTAGIDRSKARVQK